MEIDLEENSKIVHKFNEKDIEIVIEMPATNNEENKDIINDIEYVMSNELLVKLNK